MFNILRYTDQDADFPNYTGQTLYIIEDTEGFHRITNMSTALDNIRNNRDGVVMIPPVVTYDADHPNVSDPVVLQVRYEDNLLSRREEYGHFPVRSDRHYGIFEELKVMDYCLYCPKTGKRDFFTADMFSSLGKTPIVPPEIGRTRPKGSCLVPMLEIFEDPRRVDENSLLIKGLRLN